MIENLEEWVLQHYGVEIFTPGLDRINLALADLKKDLAHSQIVIIAGTNGKGETTHRLGRHFKTASYCTWTSPHITSITERFSSQTGDIEISELKKLFLECHETIRARKFQLTYYEFLFYVFCRWAVIKKADYLFLEVGLGGRLDAVNALDANLVLLTSISRDHQEFLGNRYDLILQEKLGVLRPEANLISFLDLKYLRERAAARALRLNAYHLDLGDAVKIPAYEFSKRNQFLAYAAFCHLTGAPLAVENWTPSSESLTSRGEIILSDNEWWPFGSHNVDGVRKLIQFLHSKNYNSKDYPFNAVVTSFSKRNENDILIMLKMLKKAHLGKVYVTAFTHPKACPRDVLQKLTVQEGLTFVENISEHVQGWTHQKILVLGSYYFLGELQHLFRSR
jgi:dihydrofolate synthase/folylpolyglutamate synthase